MRVFSSTEIARKFGAIARIVQAEPICVQLHGHPRLIMLSPAEYERLRRLDRRVYSADSLSHGLRTAIAAVQPSARAAGFNGEA